jgi:nickel-dependent lactate racemase
MQRTFEIGYGRGTRSFAMEEDDLLLEMKANETPVLLTGEAEIRRAMEAPIGAPRLREVVSATDSVCIVTSDVTRPMPTALALPLVLEELDAAGVPRDRITVVFGLGSHRPHTEEEKRRLVGPSLYGTLRLLDSDESDMVPLGTTSRGTPVDVFGPVARADRRICLGNIEMHYFAGYSGGAKAIMPGVSTRSAIQANHSRMVEPAAAAGRIEGNPIREDIEEAGALCGIDWILNVVLDEDKRVVHAVAGHPVQAHRAGCLHLDAMYKIAIPHLADVVIATPGGYPKDINLYQAQKALDNAQHAVREGGCILLAASCAEGLGEHVFENWLRDACSPDETLSRIRRDFQLGGHKAAAIAMVRSKCRILLVSDLPSDAACHRMMEPFSDLQSAVDEALRSHRTGAGVIVMPHAGSTLPFLPPPASFRQPEGAV